MDDKTAGNSIELIVKYGHDHDLKSLDKHLTLIISKIMKDYSVKVDRENQMIMWRSFVQYGLVNEHTKILCSDAINELRGAIQDNIEQIYGLTDPGKEVELRCLAAALNDEDIEKLKEEFTLKSPIDFSKDIKYKKVLTLLSRCENPSAISTLKKISPKNYQFIPPGSFILGGGDNPDDKISKKVWLPAYYISKFPVTVAEYQKYLKSTKYKHKMSDLELTDVPAHGVTWYEADNYARWKGACLPTEAQWEKAANGNASNLFPWGNEFDSNKANTFENGINELTSVKKYIGKGDSPFGVTDMIGNCWEWTSSRYGSYYDTHGHAPLGAEDGRDRVLRGGAYDFDQNGSNCTNRYCCNPNNGWDTHGFRLVCSL